MADVIAYVDGFNLYHGLRDRFSHKYLWLDVNELVRRLRPRDSIVAVRYFTAMVRDDQPAEARQQAYLDALTARNGERIEIVYGRFQATSQMCHGCGRHWITYEEKETDVNIAASLVADAAAARSDLALLISADADLCPAIRTARVITAGRANHFGVITAFPPKRYSHDLKRLAPGAFTISHADIRNSLLPDTFTAADTGRKFQRPPKWY